MSENAWIEHRGGECPVAPDAMIVPKFADGHVLFARRGWAHDWTKPCHYRFDTRLSGPSA